MKSSLPLLAFAAASLASPTPSRPRVTIRNGTLIGESANDVDSFTAIPYAKPPLKDLRLRPPQTIDHSFGTLRLPKVAPGCINMKLSSPDTSDLPQESAWVIGNISLPIEGPQSEDCLSLNVQRPAGTKPGDKLPVLFWIYGGGFEIGATSSYDGTAIIGKSLAMDQPVIYVAPNYRLNAFGFLHGKQLQKEGNTNLGLRDQRKALEWVAENIEAFGGDPDKVTIWGESAGAASVFQHMLAYEGDHTYRGKPLFRAGIMNSGTILRTLETTSAKAQKVFDDLASYAGCDPDSGNVLSCLRKLSTKKFIAAMNSLPDFMQPSANNLAYIPRPDPTDDFFPVSPEVSIAKGLYARVPVITGNQQDESTIFSITQKDLVNDTSSLVDFMTTMFGETSRCLVEDLVATYPDDPAAGLPADTGSKYELYPQFKRLAALQSDQTFMSGRRHALSYLAPEVPAWTYLATYLHEAVPYFGTYHTSDLGPLFSLKQNEFAANAMDGAYINFVNHLDPNGGEGEEQWWPQWDEECLAMANFGAEETTIIRDDFRWESTEFWKKHATQLRQ